MNSHDQALYELMSERYDGLQADCGALRASLHDLEKRHEEKTAALEVAQRERDEARAWKVEYRRQVAEKDEQVAEVHLLLFKAEADRDTALAQAAGLREALTQVCKLAGNWQTQDQIYDIIREALATPGPTIGEIKAEAQAQEMDRWAERWWDDHSEITSLDFCERARELRSFAARLRGGVA